MASLSSSDVHELRQLFPASASVTYLNHASTGLLPAPAAEAMASVIARREWRRKPNGAAAEAEAAKVRELIAQLLHATPAEICFTSNTSHGLNIVAAGLDWKPGDNVVCAETEFVANVYPWLNLQRKGVEVRFAQAKGGRIPLDAISAQMDSRTRLVAISFVEFLTGYRNDVAAVSELCRRNEALLCVDGIQGLGALPLDVKECGVDFLAGHAAKWLLGPIGIGFLYCRRDRLCELDLAMGGWRGVIEPREFFRYESDWCADCRRFEVGSLNRLGIAGMGASLQLLLELGIECIAERIFSLTGMLLGGLEDASFQIVTPHSCQEERSGIVSFVPRDRDPEQLAQRLENEGIVVSARGPCIRVSPHFYNTEAEIDRFLVAVGA